MDDNVIKGPFTGKQPVKHTPVGVAAGYNSKPPIMKFFEYAHLPEKLQVVSAPICDLAIALEGILPDSAEKAAGLRKLLEAKDCLVRAVL